MPLGGVNNVKDRLQPIVTHRLHLWGMFVGQQLSTITNHFFLFWGQQLSTITNNFFAPLVAIAAIVIANIVSNIIEDN